MEPLNKKGKTIHSEAREIVRKVIQECDEEATRNTVKFAIKQANKRISNYTGISERTVTRIRKESSEAGESSLTTPGKNRPRPAIRNVTCDSFDINVIKMVIHNFYVVEKKVPTCKKLLANIRDKIQFPWGEQSLRRLLKRIGYQWKKCNNRRKVLIERPDIVDKRFHYLRKIREYRRESRQIIYIDESWVDANLTFRKCWQSESEPGVITDTSSSNRLIIAHAGSEDGFVEGALLNFKAGTTSGDYHGQMNTDNFGKWVKEKLLCLPSDISVDDNNLYVPVSNIPCNSVIIMDNAPYHSAQLNKPPSKSSVKKVMIEWLQKNYINCSENMRKAELFELIQLHKPPTTVYIFDELFKKYGHTVLRLPPYMCDLNPIELAWAKVKRVIRSENITGDYALNKLKTVTNEAVQKVTTEDWVGFCSHVKKVEKEYWEKDGIVEDVVDSLIISVGEGDTSDDFSDYECDSPYESGEESELAEPLPEEM